MTTTVIDPALLSADTVHLTSDSIVIVVASAASASASAAATTTTPTTTTITMATMVKSVLLVLCQYLSIVYCRATLRQNSAAPTTPQDMPYRALFRQPNGP